MPTLAQPRRRKKPPLPLAARRWLLGGNGKWFYWLVIFRQGEQAFWDEYRAWLLEWHKRRGFPVPRRCLGHQAERAFLRAGRERTTARRRKCASAPAR